MTIEKVTRGCKQELRKIAESSNGGDRGGIYRAWAFRLVQRGGLHSR